MRSDQVKHAQTILVEFLLSISLVMKNCNMRQISIVLLIVHSVSDYKHIGDIKTSVSNGQVDYPPG